MELKKIKSLYVKSFLVEEYEKNGNTYYIVNKNVNMTPELSKIDLKSDNAYDVIKNNYSYIPTYNIILQDTHDMSSEYISAYLNGIIGYNVQSTVDAIYEINQTGSHRVKGNFLLEVALQLTYMLEYRTDGVCDTSFDLEEVSLDLNTMN